MILKERTPGEKRAYLQGVNAGLEYAASRLERANGESVRESIIDLIRHFRAQIHQIDDTPTPHLSEALKYP